MKISLNWVKQYTDVDLSTDELVKLATERLGGVEGVIDLSKQYEGIIVAKVVSCVKHPNADKLSLCKVDDGRVVGDVARDENGYVQVVCGAPNVREGLLVAWIPPGATVPASYGEKELFVLEARDLRGETSNGMLASLAELGLGDDHSGILEIDPEEKTAGMPHPEPVEGSSGGSSGEQISRQTRDDNTVKPGTPFKNLYDLDDTILEIENKMFTHRPDGFGHLGVAREIAGIQHKAFKSPEWYSQRVISTEVEKSDQGSRKAQDGLASGLSVSIQDGDLCPRYMAVVLEDVKIAPSPLWLQSYLKRVGVRPINNVVDVTNYMMLLTAQPLHAFDFDKIARDGKAEITVRRPKDGEKMTLLDGKTLEPHKDAVLICSEAGPIALGGIMGGGNSEVDENTRRIVLECATFDMYNIRKTSMVHGIFTDAVTRFTKGQPAAQLPPVIVKAISMFEELARAKQTGEIVDTAVANYDQRSTNHDYIEIDAKFINDRLGSKFSNEQIIQLLTNVEIEAHEASGPIEVRPPFWRTDLEIKEDIVEEIGRLYGFNQLPIALPERSIAPITPDSTRTLKAKIRGGFARAGANEVLGYSFVHGNLLAKAGQDSTRAYAIRNALSPDLQYYRLSLLPSLLEKVHPNIKAGYGQFSLFEIGKVHYKGEMDERELNVPNEDDHVACVIAYDTKVAPKGSPYYAARRYLAEIDSDLVESLVPMKDFNLAADEWGQQLAAPYEPDRSALVVVDNQIWGVVGEFKTTIQKAFKLPDYAAGFEVHLGVLQSKEVGYKPLSRFPSSEQDITLKVASSVNYAELASSLAQIMEDSEYQYTLEPRGIYQKEPKTKNITFHLTLSHRERTLTTIEVNKLVENLTWQAHERFAAEQV
ncbi:MAG: phenylalanine--tRNA ligase subunit beta [Candidatus Saccharimonadales bacterium]